MLAEWAQHPVTKAVQAWALRERERVKEEWAIGHFFGETEHQKTALEAKALGVVETLAKFINLELGDFDASSE